MAEITKTTILDIDATKSTKSISDLRKEMKALKDQMAGVEEGTQEFYDLANAAGTVKHQIDEIQQAVNGASADFGDMLNNATKTATGIVGGFQAVKGALTLMGVESENVEKAIQKMQASMAIIQGLEAVDNGIKGFKKLTTAIKLSTKGLGGFKSALISTGLGAFVVLLGELIAHWDEVTEAMKRWGIVAEDSKKKQEELNKAQEEHLSNLHKLQNDYDEWVRNNKVAKLNTESKKSYDELALSIEDYQRQLDIIVEKQKDTSISRQHWEELNNEGKALQDNIKLLKDQQDAILNNAKSYEVAEKTKQTVIKETKQVEKETTKAENVDELKFLKTNYQYQLELLQKDLDDKLISYDQYDERRKEIEAAYNQDLKDQLETIFTDETVSYDKRLDALKEFNELRAAEATAVVEENGTIQTESTSEDEKDGISDKITQAMGVMQDSITAVSDNPAWNSIFKNMNTIVSLFDQIKSGSIEAGKEGQAYAKIAGASFAAVGSMLNGLADTQDKTNKEGFEKAKKLQIASAVMNMLGGIAMALSGVFTTKSGPWDIALAAIQAGVIAATTGVQIAQIQKQQFDGGTNVPTSTPSISASALSAAQTPVQYTQDVQGASIEESIKDTRVYVVESDITNAQTNVSVAESENRY